MLKMYICPVQMIASYHSITYYKPAFKLQDEVAGGITF